MLFAVRTRVVRLGTDRLMDEEMDATRLLARRSVRRRLRRGRFPSAVMELSVKSMASCWSWIGVRVRSDDGERDGCDQTIHAFVTPKFSIVGILYPLRRISETRDMEVADSPRRSSWRSLMGFIAEGACASSSGVSLTMAEVVQAVSDSDENEVDRVQPLAPPMKPVYQRLNLSVHLSVFAKRPVLTRVQIYRWPGCLHLCSRGTARRTVPHHTQVHWRHSSQP